MNNEEIIAMVNEVVMGKLKGISFDKALPEIRRVLWEIADENGLDGAEVFEIYMNWLSEQKDKQKYIQEK